MAALQAPTTTSNNGYKVAQQPALIYAVLGTEDPRNPWAKVSHKKESKVQPYADVLAKLQTGEVARFPFEDEKSAKHIQSRVREMAILVGWMTDAETTTRGIFRSTIEGSTLYIQRLK